MSLCLVASPVHGNVMGVSEATHRERLVHLGEAPEMTMSSACLKAGQNLLSHLHIRELSPQAEVSFSADVEGTNVFSVGCNAVRPLLYSTPYCAWQVYYKTVGMVVVLSPIFSGVMRRSDNYFLCH